MWRRLKSRADTLLLSCLVLSFIDRANSISCFKCNSYTDQGCEDLLPTDTKSPYYQPCEENSLERPIFCRKVHLKVKMEFLAGGLHERIIRSCGWKPDDKKRECYRREDKDHVEVVCQCFEDGCNSASGLLNHSIVVLTSIFAMVKIIL